MKKGTTCMLYFFALVIISFIWGFMPGDLWCGGNSSVNHNQWTIIISKRESGYLFLCVKKDHIARENRYIWLIVVYRECKSMKKNCLRYRVHRGHDHIWKIEKMYKNTFNFQCKLTKHDDYWVDIWLWSSQKLLSFTIFF